MIARPDRGAKEARLRLRNTNRLRDIDRGLAITFVLLLVSGLIVLYAASYYNAQDGGCAL